MILILEVRPFVDRSIHQTDQELKTAGIRTPVVSFLLSAQIGIPPPKRCHENCLKMLDEVGVQFNCRSATIFGYRLTRWRAYQVRKTGLLLEFNVFHSPLVLVRTGGCVGVSRPEQHYISASRNALYGCRPWFHHRRSAATFSGYRAVAVGSQLVFVWAGCERVYSKLVALRHT